jgi:hypothetical protein
VVTGLLLIVVPAFFVRLLFAGELFGPGRALAPLGGFGLLALALACWPSRAVGWSAVPALRAFSLFSMLSAAYLIYRGVEGADVGILLWPAAVFHAILALFLGWVLFRLPSESLA